MNSSTRGHSQTIDLLRGVAAMAVVVFHFSLRSPKMGITIPGGDAGATGVQLFFVLSGFLIGKSVLSARFDRRDYCLNRLFRILPNYYFSILLLVAFVSPAFLLTAKGLGDVVAHLFMVHGWFPDYILSINGVYWTLSNEALFYVFMLVVAPLIRHRRGGWWVAVGMILTAAAYKWWVARTFVSNPTTQLFYNIQFPGALDQFGCGLLVALLDRVPGAQGWLRQPLVKWSGLFLAVGALIWLLDLYLKIPRIITFHWGNTPMLVAWPVGFSAACAVLILLIRFCEKELGPWIRWTGLPAAGVISYSIYLYHSPIIRVFSGLAGEKSAASPWVIAAWMLVCVLLFSTAAYWAVERPFMRMRERARQPGAAPAVEV